MLQTTVATLSKMIESLPEAHQELLVEHIREYVEELRDELQWNKQFENTQDKLMAAARRARQQMEKQHAKPMNAEEL